MQRKQVAVDEYFYRPQRSWAKVIFSQASVCPQGGRGSVSVHAGIYPPPPGTRHPPGADTPPQADTPLGSRLQHTVNERPVCILLECILVPWTFPRETYAYFHLSFCRNNAGSLLNGEQKCILKKFMVYFSMD